LDEPLGGAEGQLEAVSFKKAAESMGRERMKNVRWKSVPDCGDRDIKSTGGKGSANTRNRNRLVFTEHRESVRA